MNFDFENGQITLVIAPVDMRAGYRRLAAIASAFLGIDVGAGGQFVVFISKRREIAKMIWSDSSGSAVLTRRLHSGRFERFLAETASMSPTRKFTEKDLMNFLDGRPLLTKVDRLCD